MKQNHLIRKHVLASFTGLKRHVISIETLIIVVIFVNITIHVLFRMANSYLLIALIVHITTNKRILGDMPSD